MPSAALRGALRARWFECVRARDGHAPCGEGESRSALLLLLLLLLLPSPLSLLVAGELASRSRTLLG